jgi:hypothetical protein
MSENGYLQHGANQKSQFSPLGTGLVKHRFRQQAQPGEDFIFIMTRPAKPPGAFKKQQEPEIIFGWIKVVTNIKAQMTDNLSHHPRTAAADPTDDHRTGQFTILLHQWSPRFQSGFYISLLGKIDFLRRWRFHDSTSIIGPLFCISRLDSEKQVIYFHPGNLLTVPAEYCTGAYLPDQIPR